MIRSELCASVAARSLLSKASIATALDVLTSSIVDALAEGEIVTVAECRKFPATTRAARQGRDSRTGEPVAVDRPGAVLQGRECPSRRAQPIASRDRWTAIRLTKREAMRTRSCLAVLKRTGNRTVY